MHWENVKPAQWKVQESGRAEVLARENSLKCAPYMLHARDVFNYLLLQNGWCIFNLLFWWQIIREGDNLSIYSSLPQNEAVEAAAVT